MKERTKVNNNEHWKRKWQIHSTYKHIHIHTHMHAYMNVKREKETKK